MRPRWSRYLVALVAVAAALAIRGALTPWLGERVPFITLFGAVIVAAWFGGMGPALLAALLGWVGAETLFVPPIGALTFRGTVQVLEFLTYLLSSLLIAALGSAMHKARVRLEESEQRFRGFMENSPSSMFLKDEAGRYLFMNRAAQSLVANAQWLGKTDREILSAAAAETIVAHDQQVLQTGAPHSYELTLPQPGGERRLYSTKFPLRDVAGKRYIGSITVDVTEQRRVEEQLQLVTDTMSAAVARLSAEDRYLWVNRVYAEWHKKRPEDIIGRTTAEVLGAEQAREIRPHIERVLTGKPVRYERMVDYPGLGRRWAAAVYSPTFDAAGKPSGWVAVVWDIDERKTMEEALRVANRRKDEFLATLAHELRNPLAPIRNAVALLAKSGASELDLTWSRGVIDRQVDQMSRLIDDLLDMARISSGKLLLRRQTVTLESVIDLAVETSRPHIDAAGHRLGTRLAAGQVRVDADPTRLAQVFSNLLNNAAKYTPHGGVISLAADQEADEVVVTVTDSGLGFPPELASEIFEPFSQWTASDEQPSGGLGIGLALVRGILELHGGSVAASSAGPGQGSCFEVRLRVAKGYDKKLPAAAAPQAVAPAGLRVLIADDNRDAADSLSRILTLYGYEVSVAYDGLSALELSAAFQPSVAVLDIGMPGANGYDVARSLRETHGRKLKLIALTGWGQEDDRRRAAEAGFDHHMTKPVDPQTLNELIAGL